MYRFYKYLDKETNSIVIIAASTYAGKPVRGIAKCRADDTFDEEKGKELAMARCNLKVSRKRLKNAHKKLQEATAVSEKAQKRVNKMLSYVSDAEHAIAKAEEDLKNLEKECQ